MIKHNKINDPSHGRGVFHGDLKYGRRNGNLIERGDYTGEQNQPIAPLVLVQPRNPGVWTQDTRIKKAKSKAEHSQQAINYLLTSYQDNLRHLRGNIHLTIGKQKF